MSYLGTSSHGMDLNISQWPISKQHNALNARKEILALFSTGPFERLGTLSLAGDQGGAAGFAEFYHVGELAALEALGAVGVAHVAGDQGRALNPISV